MALLTNEDKILTKTVQI